MARGAAVESAAVVVEAGGPVHFAVHSYERLATSEVVSAPVRVEAQVEVRYAT